MGNADHREARCDWPIIQYWHSSQVPVDVTELMATFRDRNSDLRHLVFCAAEAEEFIEEHFTSREVAAFRSCGVPAMQADYFRYCAVLTLGGFSSDIDFRCLRPLDSLLTPTDKGLLLSFDRPFSPPGLRSDNEGLPPRREPTEHLMNGFFMFRVPGNQLLRLALDVATENIERRVAATVHMVTGPWVFSMLRLLHKLGSFDAVRRDAIGKRLARLVDSAIAGVGDFDRLAGAFERVHITPLETARPWIGRPEYQPDYKQGIDHWINWQQEGRSIFR